MVVVDVLNDPGGRELLFEKFGLRKVPVLVKGDQYAFGQMLEDWCRRYAKRAEASARTRFTTELPTHPGAADEIEDVVTVDHGRVRAEGQPGCSPG